MQLQPRREPGRSDRKAATYATEIVQLRARGYTYEAIREALAEVGVHLSEASLRREMRRDRRSAPSTGLATQPSARAFAPAAPPPPSASGPSVSSASTGREIAEAFFNAHPSNPLLRAKETP
jgi:hypothetical protein